MFEGARQVCARLKLNGYVAYLAGGCVRDHILGREPKDYDIATSARPEDVRVLFDRTVLVGEAFGVVRVRLAGHEYEVATFRTDGEYVDGRRPKSVTFSTAEEDVKRRDFTINALLMDPETMEVIDHVGGKRDLEEKRIRAVGDPNDRFGEDKLRRLRAIRFACQLGFQIEEGTALALGALTSDLDGVSPERITAELSKIWRSGPGEGWRMLHGYRMLSDAIPYVTKWRRGGAMDRLDLEPDLTSDQREAMAWAISLLDPGIPVGDAEEELRKHTRLPNSMI